MSPVVEGFAEAVESLGDLPAECARQFEPVAMRLGELIQVAGRVAARPSMSAAQVAAIGNQLTTAVVRDGALVKAIRWRNAALGTGLLAGAAAAGFAGGCYWHAWSRQPPVAAVTSCRPAPQANGGEAFTCTFWTHLPTPGER